MENTDNTKAAHTAAPAVPDSATPAPLRQENNIQPETDTQPPLGMYQSEELETGPQTDSGNDSCPTFLSELRPGFWDSI